MAHFTLTVGFFAVLGVLQGGWFVNALPAVSDDTDPAEDLANTPIAKAFTSSSMTIEFFYRLDVVPCALPEPQANWKTTVNTFIYYEWFTGTLKCFVYMARNTELHFNRNNQLFNPIRPEKDANGHYKSKALERYHIDCPDGVQCTLDMTKMDLQEQVSIGGQEICLDYVLIDNPKKNTKTEYCGNKNLTNYLFNGPLYITFRSGDSVQKTGFQIQITKLNSASTEECIQEEDASMEQGERAAPYPLQGDNNRNDNDIKDDQENIRYIPSGAKDRLLYFYDWYNNQAHKASVESHEGILRLAVLSERSCNPLTSAIAEEVLSLFPEQMTTKARAQIFNDNTDYDESDGMEFA